MNIVEPILFQCKLNPFATAIATPGSGLNSIKYGHLERLIHNVARAALRTGLTPGQTVALLIEDVVLHAALALGLMRIGIEAGRFVGEERLDFGFVVFACTALG